MPENNPAVTSGHAPEGEGERTAEGNVFLKRETRRAQLWTAIQTRIVSFEELQEIGAYGYRVSVRSIVADDGRSAWTEPYNEHDQLLEYQCALLLQLLLRNAQVPICEPSPGSAGPSRAEQKEVPGV